jgi:hypothetical protein
VTHEQEAATHAIDAIGAGLIELGGPLGAAFGAGLLIGAHGAMAIKSLTEEETDGGDGGDGGPSGGEPPDGGVSGGVDAIINQPVTVVGVAFLPVNRSLDPSVPTNVYDQIDTLMRAFASTIAQGRAFRESLTRHKWGIRYTFDRCAAGIEVRPISSDTRIPIEMAVSTISRSS